MSNRKSRRTNCSYHYRLPPHLQRDIPILEGSLNAGYFPECEFTESTLPSGSLNHATWSPDGDVQMPSSLSATKGYLSVLTPRLWSHSTTGFTSFTSHPSTVP